MITLNTARELYNDIVSEIKETGLKLSDEDEATYYSIDGFLYELYQGKLIDVERQITFVST